MPETTVQFEPERPPLRRIDFFREVKPEQELKKKQKLEGVLMKARLRIYSFYYGLNVQNMANKFGNFLKLYHESLQALVQGYREVTMDAKGDFRFEKDGRTVQEKLDAYERKLDEYASGVASRVSDKADK